VQGPALPPHAEGMERYPLSARSSASSGGRQGAVEGQRPLEAPSRTAVAKRLAMVAPHSPWCVPVSASRRRAASAGSRRRVARVVASPPPALHGPTRPDGCGAAPETKTIPSPTEEIMFHRFTCRQWLTGLLGVLLALLFGRARAARPAKRAATPPPAAPGTGTVTTYQYDALDRPTRVTGPYALRTHEPGGFPGEQTSWVVAVTDAQGLTSFRYTGVPPRRGVPRRRVGHRPGPTGRYPLRAPAVPPRVGQWPPLRLRVAWAGQPPLPPLALLASEGSVALSPRVASPNLEHPHPTRRDGRDAAPKPRATATRDSRRTPSTPPGCCPAFRSPVPVPPRSPRRCATRPSPGLPARSTRLYAEGNHLEVDACAEVLIRKALLRENPLEIDP
jgi:hypothetical protein